MLDAYVYDAVRTPRGRVRRGGGTLAGVPPQELVGQLLQALDERNGLADSRATVDGVVLGASTATGEQGGDIARVATIWAGWPDGVSGTVVSRACCSGLDAIAQAAMQVSTGTAELMVGGGVESMSRVPMMSDEPSIALDREVGERTGFVTIGVSADATAHHAGLARPELDGYGHRSHQRSAAAWATGHYARSVVPVTGIDGAPLLAADEGIRTQLTAQDFADLAVLCSDEADAHERVARRLPGLGDFPAVHTAATAPQLADAASAVLIGSLAAGELLGRAPRGRILAAAATAVRSPLLTATVPAIRRALVLADVDVRDVDTVEVNESFAVSPLYVMSELDFSEDMVNCDGGAIAMGHPLGASGGILLATALDRLERTGGRYGVVTIPAVMGLGSALVIERLDGVG